MLFLTFLAIVATFLPNLNAKNLPSFIGRRADEDGARQFQERGDCSSPSCIFTPGFQRQERGINDGSLASRLLEDILQFENMARVHGMVKTERETQKRSHGLLDNLLRPPPQADTTVTLTDRIAEDIVDTLARMARTEDPLARRSVQRRRREVDSIPVGDEA